MTRSILILSGGLDSTVSSCLAVWETTPILALTFDYGQRASRREQQAARSTAQRLKVPHRTLALPWLKELTATALVSTASPLPQPEEKDLDDIPRGIESASRVWVPNRNGVFLNIGAAFAEFLDAEVVVTGFNAEEGITFPDNSEPFVRAADEFFWYSTKKRVRVISYTLSLRKIEIAQKALELKIPLRDIWFCYEGGESPCRVCESCMRGFRALREAGIPDPWSDLPPTPSLLRRGKGGGP